VIAYLDTSSLVKLYIEEDGSDAIAELCGVASVVATSVVGYAEARATFARRRRERLLGPSAHARAVRQLDADWGAFLAIEVTADLARAAGRLADRLGTRGFDAIHLASFEHLLAHAEDNDVEFSSADVRLTRAAKHLN